MRFFELLGGTATRIFKLYTNFSLKDPIKTQNQLLQSILKCHQTTLFGKKHKFNEIRSIKQFQTNCAPQNYNYFKPYIDAFISGTRNALFNTHLLYFAQTSGTTGTPKLIPITYNTITNYTLGVLRTACYYISENLQTNSNLIGGKWLYLPAPPILRYINGIPIGYITGLLMLPYGIQLWRYLLNFKIYAPLHLMQIKNVEEKFRRITEECSTKNITMLVGVTPVIINLLEYILKFSNKETIDQIFPNLQLAIFSGVPPKYYKARILKIIGRDLQYREMYAASEGMLAVQLSKLPQFTPLYDSAFFEFIPLKNPTERLIIDQVKKEEEYQLLITTHNGLYAYDIGDIVKFVSVDPPAFIFSFRKNIIDLADEKLTPSQIFGAIEVANSQNGCKIIDFCVIGLYTPKPHYIFLIEFDAKNTPPKFDQYLLSIDKALEKLNDIYYQNRNGSNKGTLAPPELWVLKENTFYSLENQKILDGLPTGQIKTTHFSKDTKLLDFFEPSLLDKIFLDN
ncbi:MAG TPA: GH3 auxin-responsive promoter family protein [Candidatus Deferrimicrobium sp.]|nr:GH3 auxin-responsive promoter family protein [Candidatus Deferrimicrobium sp.]